MERWNPWAELRDRPHITFRLTAVAAEGGGAAYYRRGNVAAIIIDPALGRRERRAALAHELIHDERGASECPVDAPSSWLPVVHREDRRVDIEVAGRLVPPAQLLSFIARHATLETLGVTVEEVAEEFDVPEAVAERALRDLSRAELAPPPDPDSLTIESR